MKECEFFSDELQEFAESGIGSLGLKKHISECGRCRRELSLIKSTIEKFSTTEEVEVPDDFSYSVMREIYVKSRRGLGFTLVVASVFGVIALIYSALGLKHYLSSSDGLIAMPVFLSKVLALIVDIMNFIYSFAIGVWKFLVSISGSLIYSLNNLDTFLLLVPVVALLFLNFLALRFASLRIKRIHK